ncbi:uL30 family ribosomal protein [Candidatus Woesearchaeota archaeon]|nr:uL30 family ribosomal protein [Candidatus Woesearchaeota archaeon]
MEKESGKKVQNGKIAIIRLRGLTGIRKPIKDTLLMLNLIRKHHCVVLDPNPSVMGMIRKAKDYITWGFIDDETQKLLVDKRSEKDSDGNMRPYFRLHPPRKGFERKGVKRTFRIGGALGDRGEKINDLIKRMI